jgi:hypothetical protein
MKVYVSYSHHDSEFAQRLATALMEAGIDVWIDRFKLQVGANIIETINKALAGADNIVVILSNSYTKSPWGSYEIGAFVVRETQTETRRVIPVLIEDCDVPLFLRELRYIDFRMGFDSPIKELIATLKTDVATKAVHPTPKQKEEGKLTSLDFQLRELRTHFDSGELSLFLGAGVSVEGGVPAWANLLRSLLASLFGKKLRGANKRDLSQRFAELFQKNFSPSALMIAQYLKNGLGNDFLETIRNALYPSDPKSCPLIDEIVELCRPQRNKQTLQSIVTFNFDNLLEENLTRSSIKHSPVYAEGQRPSRSELPVYHVHGFLPRQGPLTKDNDVVFSEDAYHSQFIDPFSWSNLTQLSHLNQYTCLFVGLSMTDPNLRRLLDVSMRRNPGRVANHYYFKKRYVVREVFSKTEKMEVEKELGQNPEDFVRLVHTMEEQDARNLGLNVIWVDTYEEIPVILKGIRVGQGAI